MKIKNLILALLVLGAFACQKSTDVEPKTDDAVFGQTRMETPDQMPDGKIVPIDLFGQKVSVLDAGDYYLFQGDIRLNKSKLKGASIRYKKWDYANNTVPYTIAANVPDKQRIYDAIKIYSDKTNINLVPRTNQADYIEFQYSKKGTYSSALGKDGGKQIIGLADWATYGNVIHEIGHALGLFHEHTRSDRDDSITINWYSISWDWWSQYYKYKYNYNGFDYGDFDFSSVMLYSSSYNEDTRDWTMTRLDGTPFEGQRTKLSAGDIAILNYLYPAK